MPLSTLCQVFAENQLKLHISSITTNDGKDWIPGLRLAFVTFLGETCESVFSEHGRLLSFHYNENSTTITSMPYKFRGEITSDDRISAGSYAIASFRDIHAL
jgi:hypothetical protein